MSLIPHPFEDDGNGRCSLRVPISHYPGNRTCGRSADLHESESDLPRGERRRLDRERAEAENRSVEKIAERVTFDDFVNERAR